MTNRLVKCKYNGSTRTIPVYDAEDGSYVRVTDLRRLVKADWKINKWNPPHGKAKLPAVAKTNGLHFNERFVWLEDVRSIASFEDVDKVRQEEFWYFDKASGEKRCVKKYYYQNVWYVETQYVVSVIGETKWRHMCGNKTVQLNELCDAVGLDRRRRFVTLADFEEICDSDQGDTSSGYLYHFAFTIDSDPDGFSKSITYGKGDYSFVMFSPARLTNPLDALGNFSFIHLFNDIELNETLIPFPARFKLFLKARTDCEKFMDNLYARFPFTNALEAYCDEHSVDWEKNTEIIFIPCSNCY